MTYPNTKRAAAATVTEEATAWLLRLQDQPCTDDALEQQFKAWLGADAAHAREHEELIELWNICGKLKPTLEKSDL